MTNRRFKISAYTLILSEILAVFFLFGRPALAASCAESTTLQSDNPSDDRPWISSGLIPSEYSDYLMAFKKQINPKSDDLSLLYGAMGPDLITGLLLTNATSIWGIDFEDLDSLKIQKYLAHWNDLENVGLLPPHDKFKYFSDKFPNFEQKSVDQKSDIYEVNYIKTFDHRRNYCYWDIQAMHVWGINRLLVAELKMMGVDPSTVQINSAFKEGLEMSFLWAFPGENLKLRTVRIIRSDLYDVMIDGKYLIPNFDVYYQKSAVAAQEYFGLVIAPAVQHLNPKGSVIYGMTYGSPIELNKFSRELESTVLSADSNFSSISIDPSLDQTVRLHMRKHRSSKDYDDYSYGWRLNVFSR